MWAVLAALYVAFAGTTAPGQETNTASETTNQSWNFHAQNTGIVQGYPGFSARYSGPHSLQSGGEVRETISLDLLTGARLWPGAEAHVDGLLWQGFGLSGTEGVEGFPNGEAFKSGTSLPSFTFARLFVRQTIGLGGEREEVADGPLVLGGQRDISRLTFTLGRFSAKDIFDNNAYANDPRTQFMNWSLMANSAWDYPADPVGYTTGLAAELNQPKWAVRFGWFQMPGMKNWWTAEDRFLKFPPESSAGDGKFWRSWDLVAELERRYNLQEHPGALRLLAFLNQANMGTYEAALLEPQADISRTRGYRCKYGFGLNWEQEIARNAGVFSRLGWNDGRNEGWTFTDVNYSGSLGLSFKGAAWHRPGDTFGVAGVFNGISGANQRFLQAGGIDILDGDGALTYGWEKILETYYAFQLWPSLQVSLDYQYITNPAFNRDRGPVSVFAARMHWEF